MARDVTIGHTHQPTSAPPAVAGIATGARWPGSLQRMVRHHPHAIDSTFLSLTLHLPCSRTRKYRVRLLVKEAKRSIRTSADSPVTRSSRIAKATASPCVILSTTNLLLTVVKPSGTLRTTGGCLANRVIKSAGSSEAFVLYE